MTPNMTFNLSSIEDIGYSNHPRNIDLDTRAKIRLLDTGTVASDEETRAEIKELFNSFRGSKGSPEYNFFVKLIQTPVGEKLFEACYVAISQIKYTGYIFAENKYRTVDGPRYQGKFNFKIGYKSIFIDEMGIRSGADRLKVQAKDIVDKTIQDDIKYLFDQKEVVPLLKDHEKEIKQLGDVDNIFIALLNEKRKRGAVKDKTLRLCSSRIAKWLSNVFYRSEYLLNSTKKVLDLAKDDMRSTEFIEKRNDEHRKNMVSRVCGILRENTGLASTVVEQALDEITIEMVMDA